MNVTIRRPRSCLGWLAWVFGLLLVLFALSYTIDMARLANAWHEADTLAAKLGYTPERHLVDQASTQLGFPFGTGTCEIRVFFTTPLDPSDFTAHLEQAVAPLRDGSPTNGRNMYVEIPLTVDGSNTDTLSRDLRNKLPPVYEHRWLVMSEDGPIKMRVVYAELAQAQARIEYYGRPITENVAYVSVDAGEFPFWIWASKCISSRERGVVEHYQTERVKP